MPITWFNNFDTIFNSLYSCTDRMNADSGNCL